MRRVPDSFRSHPAPRSRPAPPRRALWQIAVTAFVVLASGCGAPSHVDHATVLEVIDGDTVRLRIQGQAETARLLGVDTPETVHPNRPVECFGPQASARTAALLPAGSRVEVRRDRDPRDRFGRLLLYLYREGETVSVNEALLRDGYATVLDVDGNTGLADRFRAAEARARQARSGIWGACAG